MTNRTGNAAKHFRLLYPPTTAMCECGWFFVYCYSDKDINDARLVATDNTSRLRGDGYTTKDVYLSRLEKAAQGEAAKEEGCEEVRELVDVQSGSQAVQSWNRAVGSELGTDSCMLDFGIEINNVT